MLDAKFYINPNPDFPNMPCFSFTNENVRNKYWMLGELNRCNVDYIITEVLPGIEKVVQGELEEYEFGYDATIIDFRKDVAIINYNFFEDKIEIPSEDIYDFMSAWGKYLSDWKRQNEN